MRACRMCDPDRRRILRPGVPATPYVQCDHVTPTGVVAIARPRATDREGPRRAGRSCRPVSQALRLVRS